MCNQVKSVTLQTAILMQVKEFATSNVPFSVHDITRTIREKTSKDELEIPEVEVIVTASSPNRFEISHAKVKSLFDELWRTGVFDPEFTLNRSFTGMYFEYTPQLVGNVSAAPCPMNVPVPSVPYTATAAHSADTSIPDYISENNTVRVKLYLANCVRKNFRPTLKQIQSAIKRDEIPGCSCGELRAYITTLGYTIVDDPDAISKSQVATV